MADKLFKILGDKTRELYTFVKLIKSKQKYKVLFPELVSNVLHYLNIISLSNLSIILIFLFKSSKSASQIS